jgi:hypothetical protein
VNLSVLIVDSRLEFVSSLRRGGIVARHCGKSFVEHRNGNLSHFGKIPTDGIKLVPMSHSFHYESLDSREPALVSR